MNIRLSSTLGIAALCLFMICFGCKKQATEKTNSYLIANDVTYATALETVSFGTPPVGGGVCAGMGICNTVALGQNQPNVNGTTVTFLVSSANPGTLVLNFSLAALQKNQPGQVNYFTSPLQTYVPAGTFTFSDASYAPLGLLPGANINPQTPGAVVISGDTVTVSFNYAHS